MSKRSTRTARSLVAGIEVEDLAADRELAAVLDLVDAHVAHRGELLGDLAEVDEVALADREAVRAQLGVGDLLAERDGGDDDDRRFLLALLASMQRVERGDAQADEVRRRREVRLVRDAAAGIEADGPRREPGGEVGGQVAGLAVVAGDHERRLVGRRPRAPRRRTGAAPARRTRARPRAAAWRRRGRR